MLFPGGRVSDIQEKQMTSVLDSNIHVVQVDDVCSFSLAFLFSFSFFFFFFFLFQNNLFIL